MKSQLLLFSDIAKVFNEMEGHNYEAQQKARASYDNREYESLVRQYEALRIARMAVLNALVERLADGGEG